MKRKFMLIPVLALLLCGCVGEDPAGKGPAPTTAPETVAETEASEDIKLTILKVTLENGEALTLTVMGKQAMDHDLYGVREVLVYRGETLIQTLSMAEAIAKDGVDGIDVGYTESFSIEDAAKLRDVDFDGNPDLEVCGWCPNNAIPYYYWLWDPEAEQFRYGFQLQLRETDEENRQLIAWYKVENGLYHTDYYRVGEDRTLELIQREVEDVRP